jgi:hypothetical protein
MRKKARTTSILRGRELLAPDEIMISPLMSKVNGLHEEWAETHAAPQHS